MADLHIERWKRDEYTLDHGWWAVCDRADDDGGPYPPVALFAERADAERYLRARHPDDPESPLVFDAVITPAIFVGDELVVSNDYEIETHAHLREVAGG